MTLCPHCEAYSPVRTLRRHREVFFNLNTNSWKKDPSLAMTKSPILRLTTRFHKTIVHPIMATDTVNLRVAMIYFNKHCLVTRFGMTFSMMKLIKTSLKTTTFHPLMQIRHSSLPTAHYSIALLSCFFQDLFSYTRQRNGIFVVIIKTILSSSIIFQQLVCHICLSISWVAVLVPKRNWIGRG